MGIKKGTAHIITGLTISTAFGVFGMIVSMIPSLLSPLPASMNPMPRIGMYIIAGFIAVWVVSVAVCWAFDDMIDRVYQRRVERWQALSKVEREIIELKRKVVGMAFFMIFFLLSLSIDGF